MPLSTALRYYTINPTTIFLAILTLTLSICVVIFILQQISRRKTTKRLKARMEQIRQEQQTTRKDPMSHWPFDQDKSTW